MFRTLSKKLVALQWFLIVICFALIYATLFFSSRAVSAEPSDVGLRGVFRHSWPDGKTENPVGRIAIRQIRGESEQLVRLDQHFCSGDKFKIEVSSNRDGWIYLMHRQGDREPQLLWPAIKDASFTDENRVLSGQVISIPGKDVFEFDEKTGTEFFYVIITQDRAVPSLTRQGVKTASEKIPAFSKELIRKKKQKSSQHKENKPTNQLVQIGVRGVNDPQGRGINTVVYDPGTKDPERYLYFSAPEGNDSKFTLIEFQLRHI